MFDKLLQKPESYRRKVAYAATAVLGMIIFFAWLMIAGKSMREASAPAIQQKDQTAEEFKKSLPSLKDETAKTQVVPGENNNPEKRFDTMLKQDQQPEKTESEFEIMER